MKDRYCRYCGSPTALQSRKGEIREQCTNESCQKIYWNNPVPVLAAVVEYDGQVILIQNKGWPAQWYGLVTGFLEKGETPEAGIVREVEEELGLQSEVESFIGIYSFFERNELILAYHLTATGDIRMGEELKDYKIIPIEKVKPWPFATGLALRDWLNKRVNS